MSGRPVPFGWTGAKLGGHLREPIRNGYSPVCPKEPTGKWILHLGAVTTSGFNPSAVKPAPLDDPSVDTTRLEPGDLLVSRSNTRERVGLAGIYRGTPSPCSYPDLLMRVRPGPELLPAFAEHALLSFSGRAYFERVARGTSGSMVKIDRSLLEGFPLLLPPLPEQRKIAAILSSVDDTIEKTEAVIDQLQVVKKSMMEELLTRGMPGRHPRFRRTEIGELPEDWKTVTYAELAANVPAAIQSGPFGSELKHSEFVAAGRLVIGIDNVLDGRFSIGSNHRIDEAKFVALERFRARPLDLLITVMATVGRCCVVPSGIEPSIITKHVYRLTADQRRADPFFLMYCLYGIPRLSAEVRGSAQGLSRPGLNKSLLLPLRFPLPTLQEQREIVAAVQVLDDRVERERDHATCLCEVKRGLVDALLSGAVRVSARDREAAA